MVWRVKRRKRRLKNDGEESRFVTLLKFILNKLKFLRGSLCGK